MSSGARLLTEISLEVGATITRPSKRHLFTNQITDREKPRFVRENDDALSQKRYAEPEDVSLAMCFLIVLLNKQSEGAAEICPNCER